MRDTDEDWRTLAENEPYYAVFASKEFLSKHLDANALDRFYASGQEVVDIVFDQLVRYFGPFHPAIALDFGCGVGRMTMPMAAKAVEVIGVDVAPAMLKLAEQRRRELAIANVRYCENISAEPIDWLYSAVVFQHIPPERGFEILDQLLRLVRLGGRISIQLTVAREVDSMPQWIDGVHNLRFDGKTLHADTGPLSRAKGHMSMFDYDLNRLLGLFRRLGYSQIHLHSTNHGGYLGYWIFSARTESGPQAETMSLNTIIRFNANGEGQRFLGAGWSKAEDWGVWSEGAEAELKVRLSTLPDRELRLQFEVIVFVSPSSAVRKVNIAADGRQIAQWELRGSGQAPAFSLLPTHFAAGAEVRLTFQILDPVSPAELGESGDLRKLGIGLKTLTIESA